MSITEGFGLKFEHRINQVLADLFGRVVIAMQAGKYGGFGGLDQLRIKYGKKIFPEKFARTAQNNDLAARMVNKGVKRFATLYLLIPKIDSMELYSSLNEKLQLAVLITADIIPDMELDHAAILDTYDEPAKQALRWMFFTGVEDDGLDNTFDGVLDCAASILIRRYRDMSVLSSVIPLIFRRNRRGKYIHDLLWAVAGVQDPKLLLNIAGYLDSPYETDRKLARFLLNIKNIGSMTWRGQKHFSSWYHENRPYLYFIGEAFNQTSEPSLCGLDLGAKYLCCPRTAANSGGEPPAAPKDLPQEFLNCQIDRKRKMANYSHRLYRLDKRAWQKWKMLPFDRQAEIAEKRASFRYR